MTGYSPLTRRMTAIGLLAAPVIVGLGLFTIWAVSYWSEASLRIRSAEERIHVAEARAIQISGYALVQDAWKEYAATPASGLILKSAAVAEATVESRAREAFAASGGALRRYTPLPVRQEPGVDQLGAEAIGELPAEALPIFLAALETGAPRLFLDMLDVQPVDGAAAGRLRVALRVSAFRLTAEGAPLPTADQQATPRLNSGQGGIPAPVRRAAQ